MDSVKSSASRRIRDWLGTRTPRHGGWFTVAALAVLAEMGGDTWRLALRYDRAEIASGEIWRLLTGHLVHLGWTHLVLNLAGLGVLAGLLDRQLNSRDWLLYLLASGLAIGVGLYFLATDIAWYVGLSGVLHGVWGAGALLAIFGHEGRFGLALGVLLTAKLITEQWSGPLSLTETISGGNVVTASHLFGAIGGVTAAGLAAAVRRRPHAEQRGQL